MKARLATVVIAALALGAAAPAPLMAQNDSAKRLARVRAQIADLEKSLDRQIDARDDGLAQLKNIELELVATRKELDSLAARIGEQSARRDEIAAERQVASKQLAGERAALAEQLRLSYATGRQELLKLLLSQDSAADFGRMLVYYDYLNRHRSRQISAVSEDLERLGALAAENEAVASQLEKLDAEQKARARALEQDESERKALIAELDRAIADSGGRIEQMRAEEKSLNELIERLKQAVEAFPVNDDAPFSAEKGKLKWPVAGPHAVDFGDSRDDMGQLHWDGVLIEADAGTPVRSVYQGQVLLARWAPGMGLLLIVDHGEGYWSLYGHNAALLKQPGDWVAAGEVVGEVGDTGGKVETALYFGLRRDGEPVDPGPWMR